jgi:prephenate dehydratase
MNILADHQINVMNFNSTPYVGNEWEYFFYCDIEFADFENYQLAIEKLKNTTQNIKILGEYKKGI